MVDFMRPVGGSYKVQRRVAGLNNVRLDGITDLVLRAKGRSVFDIGCNRGMVGYQFAENYASVVHGCDVYEEGIRVAREVFADIRSTESRFEVVNLTEGPSALRIFQTNGYDFVLFLATYHKLRREMSPADLTELVKFFGGWTRKYFAWRGTQDQHDENEREIRDLDRDLRDAGLQRVHTSYISSDLGPAAIWARK